MSPISAPPAGTLVAEAVGRMISALLLPYHLIVVRLKRLHDLRLQVDCVRHLPAVLSGELDHPVRDLGVHAVAEVALPQKWRRHRRSETSLHRSAACLTASSFESWNRILNAAAIR